MRVGGQLLARGALLGLQGLLSAGGLVASAGTALAGLFSLPVLLGAAAIAAVGYGAYKGYKYLTRVRLSPLNKVRYAQYGFTVEDDLDIKSFAEELSGKPLSDVAFFVKEGARLAARSGKSKLDNESLDEALESTLKKGNEKSTKRMGFI
jgi:hypothetical protein